MGRTYRAGLLALLIATGCGGSAGYVVADGARKEACQLAEAKLEEALSAGDVTREEAFAQIDCLRAVCASVHERLYEAVDGAEAEQ